MPSLEVIRKRIATAEDLHSVVKMMKGMAAANIRQFEAAVESLDDYSRAIELGFQTLLGGRPERLAADDDTRDERFAAIIFGSDQGMCGRFNQQVVEHVMNDLASRRVQAANRSFFVVGGRIIPLLEAEGLAVTEVIAPATSLASITPLVQDILGRIHAWRSESGDDRIALYYNEGLGGTSYEPHTHQLFPVDMDWLRELSSRAWPTNRIPDHSIGWPKLFASLTREHLYISLFRASAESLASENASRLASMQAAERNIEERLEGLSARYRLERQHSITNELLDIISGFEALKKDKR